MYQPHTTNTTAHGLMIARNAMRLRLWENPGDGFAHRFLCHPDGQQCRDGCDTQAITERAEFYYSDLETL